MKILGKLVPNQPIEAAFNKNVRILYPLANYHLRGPPNAFLELQFEETGDAERTIDQIEVLLRLSDNYSVVRNTKMFMYLRRCSEIHRDGNFPFAI